QHQRGRTTGDPRRNSRPLPEDRPHRSMVRSLQYKEHRRAQPHHTSNYTTRHGMQNRESHRCRFYDRQLVQRHHQHPERLSHGVNHLLSVQATHPQEQQHQQHQQGLYHQQQ
ncbi:unnamed protein product, partial [Sphacelaria rigidula]